MFLCSSKCLFCFIHSVVEFLHVGQKLGFLHNLIKPVLILDADAANGFREFHYVAGKALELSVDEADGLTYLKFFVHVFL